MKSNHPIETIEAKPLSVEPAAAPAQLSRLLGMSMQEEHLAIIEHHPATSPAGPGALPIQHFNDNLTRATKPHARNGKIARLPKLERDMVNRMLNNNIPHSKIVAALDENGITVTERNVSNWKTRGGYKEWCAEQERQLQLSHLQDNLADYLRKNDATQIPEVGLQVAATQLSSMLLNPDAVQQLAANPQHYSEVVDMLCRLSTHINTLQKDRNDAVRRASIRDTAEHLKREEEKSVELTRWVYSAKIGKGPRDPEIPHRNDLPKRDELPYREPPPKVSLLDVLQHMHKKKSASPPPSPQTKGVSKPAA